MPAPRVQSDAPYQQAQYVRTSICHFGRVPETVANSCSIEITAVSMISMVTVELHLPRAIDNWGWLAKLMMIYAGSEIGNDL